MHPNPAFRAEEPARHLDFAKQRGFGVLTLNGESGPLAAHVPFLLSEETGSIELHLVRSNPILRLLDKPRPAVMIVSGPDTYVSPDWYAVADQVPTWNYVAVHLRGDLRRLPDAELEGMLARQSTEFEDRLRPKPPWTMDKINAATRARMMRMIVPCKMAVATVDGTWKLGQNKPDDVRRCAAGHVAEGGIGQETAQLAALMRDAD